MASQLPPPPPPPPLPPPPPPPPPAPVPRLDQPENYAPEAESAVQNALLTAANLLEKARCLEAEKEATLVMASSLLGHLPNSGRQTVDIANLPGGVQDAWVALSEASQSLDSSQSAASLNPIIEMAKKEETKLPMGNGQLGKAAHTVALSKCLQRAATLSHDISQLQQKDGAMLLEATSAAKGTSTSHNQHTNLWLRIFDERLRDIRSYHARHDGVDRATTRTSNKRPRLGNPSADGYDLASIMSEQVVPLKNGTLFNSEEVMGKYLDLQTIYESSVAHMKHIFAVESKAATDETTKLFGIREFLSLLHKGLDKIPEENKLKDRKKYVRFLQDLQTYLKGFLKKTAPLLQLDDAISPAIEDFENQWRKTGGANGWQAKGAEASMVDSADNSATDASKNSIDLAPYSSPEDLAKAVDGDSLKAELSKLGLKCGGTVLDRAKRLFLTKDTPLDQLPKKLFAKKDKGGANPSGGASTTAPAGVTSAKNERRVDVARREAIVMALLNQVRPTLEATLRRTERRETQTLNEREKEVEEDLHGSEFDGVTSTNQKKEGDDDEDDSDDEDEETPIYNPKGVPLGWDGKPIPYWLFKLHGLNHFYPCEICGNESYRGRRNFETHFAEAKHAFGMKSLGIPNTKHFHGVTKIEDAQNLWAKLKDTLNNDQFDGSKEEEYEDSHGNVLSRATYEDLARQGLL